MQQTRGKHSMFWWCASTKQGKRVIQNARVCAFWIIYALESATRFDRVGVLSSQAAQRRETERFVRSLADDEGFCLVGIPRLNIFRTQLGVIMVPSNQQNQTPNQNKIKMIPQSQGVDLLLFRPFKIRIFAWFRFKKVGENHRMYHSHYPP